MVLAGIVGATACDPGREPAADERDGQAAQAVHVPAPPTLLSPPNGAVLSDPRPVFRWYVWPWGARVQVEICADPGCATLVTSFTRRFGSGAPSIDLAHGLYFWRGAQLRGPHRSAWSPTFRFTIVGADDEFRPIAGTSPVTTRILHQAPRLADGRVLVVGGLVPAIGPRLASAELFDPATEAFAPTGSMSIGRSGHRATTLADGRVLVTGGTSSGLLDDALATTEIYDPSTGTFSPGPPMTIGRNHHTATLLADGRVLIAGGLNTASTYEASAETYDPVSNSFVAVGPMTVTRQHHEAIALDDGRVLVVCGPHPMSSGGGGRNEVELFDPATDTFSATDSTAIPRNSVTLARLPDGRVLVSGGSLGVGVVFDDVEVYDPVSETFGPVVTMTEGRSAHTQTTLLDGRVLAAGGYSDGGVEEAPTSLADSAETYANPSATFVPVADPMVAARARHTATLLEDGRVLLFGGEAAPAAELFVPGAP